MDPTEKTSLDEWLAELRVVKLPLADVAVGVLHCVTPLT